MTEQISTARWRTRWAAALACLVAALGGVVVTPGAAHAGTSSFNGGVFERRQVKTFIWNNANADVYAVGLEAYGVDDPDDICDVQVTRTWYGRQPSGEKEFYVTVTGDGAHRCQVRVWLRGISRFRQDDPVTLAPGGYAYGLWYNALTARNIYLVGVLATATPAGPCEIEVSTSYRTLPSGQNQFAYRSANVGDVACTFTLLHATVPVMWSYTLSAAAPGGRVGIWPGSWSPADPRIVVAGAAPVANVGGQCEFVPEPMSYYHPGIVHIDYRNVGSVTCRVLATFAYW